MDGFGGNTKAFFFEFSMPYDGQTGFNGDMPSLWMLNAQIPRTGQYSSCSCWQSGCGEFDICEVLDSGNPRCKSTYHGNTPGGSSDYFQRPTASTMKMAVVMVDDQIHVQQLDDSQDFGSSMSGSTISGISSDSSAADLLSSIFKLGS
ncbi:MAG: hypothetical protein INR71_05860 [Terriglobus roseus]|nr:hypothetical protein [Terriglobus roseus]